MGALTFKPLAFHFRPWELSSLLVSNHVEGAGALTFHLRGTQLQKITSTTWLQDQTRFAYDGFRRQRLTTPLVAGHPVGWPTAVAVWAATVAAAASFSFRVDPVSGVRFFWWLRLYTGLSTRGAAVVTVGLDTVTTAVVGHHVYGLPNVTTHQVTLPCGLPYEEEATLMAPTGVATGVATAMAQLFGQTSGAPLGIPLATPGDHHPRVATCALFQVSPLQQLLRVW